MDRKFKSVFFVRRSSVLAIRWLAIIILLENDDDGVLLIMCVCMCVCVWCVAQRFVLCE